MADHKLQPIFRPLRAKFMALGVPAGKAAAIVGLSVLGLAFALSLGSWRHVVEVPYTPLEHQEMRAELSELAYQVASMEQQRVHDGLGSAWQLALSSRQRDLLAQAEELGVTPETTEAELDAMVPETHLAEKDVVPLPVRLAVLVGLPPLVGVPLFYEGNDRTSAYKSIRRWSRFRRSQKSYPSKPRTWAESACGMGYADAVRAASERS